MARQSIVQRAKGHSGIRESRIREDLSLRGASFLRERLLPVNFCSGFGLGFRPLADLDVGVVLRLTATHEDKWREKGEV
jgi:hypothetical protein